MKVRIFSAVSRHCGIIAAAFVVLCGVTAAGTAHAQPCGGMQDLGTLGGDFTEARVSADGSVVVGTARNASNIPRAFRWTASGGMQDLGTLGVPSEANGVSADGSVVVGWARNAAGQQRAFRWTASGGMQDLGTLGPVRCCPRRFRGRQRGGGGR